MDGLKIIVAVDENGGFGKDGKIPWHFKEDFDHFKEVTKGAVCVMGRKTFTDMEEMAQKRTNKDILPGRHLYVVTSTIQREDIPNAKFVVSLRKAVEEAQANHSGKPIFVLGGEKMFTEALAWTTEVYMTVVPGHYKCDKHFPVDSLVNKFKIASGKKGKEVNFVTYRRTAQ
jgi:dihydrofolate reductase